MIACPFVARNSFLGRRSHPNTIPRGVMSYSGLETTRLHQGPYTMICPKGERLSASIHHGIAGYGPYYQLRANESKLPEYFKHGDRLLVLLARNLEGNYAVIEFSR